MTGNSKEVESDQTSIHKDLEKLVLRYLETEYMRPIAEHTQKSFEDAAKFISHWNTPIVLDSGCGTGDSTFILSQNSQKILSLELTNPKCASQKLQTKIWNFQKRILCAGRALGFLATRFQRQMEHKISCALLSEPMAQKFRTPLPLSCATYFSLIFKAFSYT